MTDQAAEPKPVERDLWWGYLCPVLANIGALRQAQSDLMALGTDWAEAGRILARVQSFYVDAAHEAAKRYVAEQTTRPEMDAIRTAFEECFQPDFMGVDWRDDGAIQTFARKVVPILYPPAVLSDTPPGA